MKLFYQTYFLAKPLVHSCLRSIKKISPQSHLILDCFDKTVSVKITVCDPTLISSLSHYVNYADRVGFHLKLVPV